jgi:hypothetical protein
MKTFILASLLALTAVSGVVVASNSANAYPFKPACNQAYIVLGHCLRY